MSSEAHNTAGPGGHGEMPHAHGDAHDGIVGGEGTNPTLAKVKGFALVVGVIGLVLAVVSIFINGLDRFLLSYLIGYLFALGLPLGCMSLLLIQHVSGGKWGFVIRRFVEAGTRLFPIFLILFIPIAYGLFSGSLYNWAGHGHHAEVSLKPIPQQYFASSEPTAALEAAQHEARHEVNVEHGEKLDHAGASGTESAHMTALRKLWLTKENFIIRAVVYFLLWMLAAFLLNKWSSDEDRAGGPVLNRAYGMFSAPFMIIHGLAITFAVVDWVMTLDAHWTSTMYGLIYIAGQLLMTVSFLVLILYTFRNVQPVARFLDADLFHDLGKLMFAFTMFFAYVSFSQFLIIWSSNISEYTPYYLYREEGIWLPIGIFLIAAHFFIPFLILLVREVKRRPARLAKLAAFIIAMRVLELYFAIVPHYASGNFHPKSQDDLSHVLEGFTKLTLADIAMPIGLGGVTLFLFLWQLKRRPILAVNDYRVPGLLSAGHH